MNILCFCLNCCVSGDILETAWQAMHSHQETHLVLVFLYSCKEPLDGEALYRQAKKAYNPFMGFVDELSGGYEHPLGDAS